MATTDVSAVRDAVDDAAQAARQRLETAREGLADRAGTVREEVTQRAGQARDHLRDRFDDADLEPNVRRAKIGFWSALRALIGALVAVPGATARGLGALSVVADDAVERGTDLRQRSREFARSVPITARQRRRARNRTVAWTAGGFAVGVIAGAIGGIVLARRQPGFADDAEELARTATRRVRSVAGEATQRAKGAAEGTAAAGRERLDEAQAAAIEATELADEAVRHVGAQAEGAAAAVAERMTSENGGAGTASAERGAGR